jgi:hypothetical protein
LAVLSPIRPGQLFRGKDTTLVFTVPDVTMTGWALRWVLRRSETEPALITKTTPSQITIDSATQASVRVTAADASALLPGVYQHALERTDTGFATTLSYGWAILEP